ncbi:MAG: enoyl-CoA hydratase [Kofleriaceae bacterium]
MSEHLHVTRAGGVVTLTMDRQDKKNALTDAMYGVMVDAMERAHADDTRVIVFRGAGEIFTAGNDLMEFAGVAMGKPLHNVGRFLHALAQATKPLVAAVQGKAVGIGTTMLLHCDHVILADNAQLTTPFVNLALVPEAASSLLLPARIGYARAYSMLALGEPVFAKDALAWGLANKVVPLSELDAAVSEVTGRIVKQPLGAMIAAKQLMRDATAIKTVMDRESAEFMERLKSAEAREAFTAFTQRRAPDFTKV